MIYKKQIIFLSVVFSMLSIIISLHTVDNMLNETIKIKDANLRIDSNSQIQPNIIPYGPTNPLKIVPIRQEYCNGLKCDNDSCIHGVCAEILVGTAHGGFSNPMVVCDTRDGSGPVKCWIHKDVELIRD